MMSKLIRKRSRKIGLPPGSLVYIGDKEAEKIRIEIFDYDSDHFDVTELASVKETVQYKNTATITWLNVSGLHDIDILNEIGKYYQIHPLIMEDILNTDQRPKTDSFDEYIFLVLKIITYDASEQKLLIEQVSTILGEHFVITFQEHHGDIFDPIRDRIAKADGRIRKRGPDYLMYALIDILVDHYFLVLENFGDQIEYLEDNVLNDADSIIVHDIHRIKSELIFLRKSIWPLREVLGNLIREDHRLIQDSTIPFLQDVYDHTIQIVDTIETYRDMVTGVLDIYLSTVSNKMNEVMKVLTIFAAIFIPLTFIAGVYGMNFEFMPELKFRWGYFILLALMLSVAVIMLVFFKKKRWL